MPQNSKTRMGQGLESNLVICEPAYEGLDHAGHPSDETEVRNKSMISRDGFPQMLDRVKWLDIGQCAKPAYLNSHTNGLSPIRSLHDINDGNNTPVLFRQPRIQHQLTKAIEALPRKEQPGHFLCYRDELKIQLGINKQPTSHICIRRQCDIFEAKSGNTL